MQALCQQGGKYRCATDRVMQALMVLLLHFLARGYVLKGGQRPSLVSPILRESASHTVAAQHRDSRPMGSRHALSTQLYAVVHLHRLRTPIQYSGFRKRAVASTQSRALTGEGLQTA